MTRTYKYRLFPRRAQKLALDSILEQGRLLYNAALEQRVETYKATGKGLSYPDQWAHFRDERRANPDTLGLLNATGIQQLLRRLDKGFGAFFRRVKAGETPGFPRFKGKNRFHSLEYRHGDGCKLRTDKTGRTVFYVQNVGEVKVKYHRLLPEGAQIKHVILKKSLRKWYVCLQCEIPDPEQELNFSPAVGIDVGRKSLLALSDGATVDNPRWLRTELSRLRVAQRRLSRKKKGSHRRRKAAFQVARIHEHIQNQRLDFWHKTTRQLAEDYSLIAVENLTLDFMIKNPHLALSAADAGLGMFRQLLSYKVEETGSRIVAVNPRNTTQACSGCGGIVPKNLSVRIHRCDCGLVLDRDVNAARNILNLVMARTEPSGANVS